MQILTNLAPSQPEADLVTKEMVEAMSSEIISEVHMDREMRVSQRIVDELLSIYM